MPRNARFYCTRPPIGTPGRLAPHPISKIAAIWPFSTDLGRERCPRRPLPDLDVLHEVQRRDPPSASRPTPGCHTPQGVSRGAWVAVRCQGSHHTAVQRPTTRPSCWSLLLLPAATDAHCSPATPSQLTQGRHRAVRSARDVPGSVDPAGMAKWGREGARSLNCRFSLCFCVPNQISTRGAIMSFEW